MKASFIVPTKNKRQFVERAAASYLKQTVAEGDELEVVFFDQASTDGTLEVLVEMASKYDGRSKVRVLNCPPNSGGAAGMNEDINWVHGQIDGEVILWGNADDFAYANRTVKTLAAFKEHNPSWVSCCQYFMSEGMMVQGETYIHDKRDRKIEFAEGIQFQVGSSGALSYARDLWDKYGPMQGIEQNDIILPVMSFLERGMYFLAEPMHAYVFHASADNQGIGGQLMAAKTEEEKLQLEEVNAFNLSSNWMSVLKRLSAAGKQVDHGAMGNINTAIWNNLQAWENARRQLTVKKISPLGMHLKP